MFDYVWALEDGYDALIFAVAIVITACAAYTKWYAPAINSVHEGLLTLNKALIKAGTALTEGAEVTSQSWQGFRDTVRTALKPDRSMSLVWRETEDRMVELETDESVRTVLMAPPSDLWAPRNLLAQRLNLPLAEAIPNVLVGLGLLLTFGFLAIALISSTSSLMDSGATSRETQTAIQSLLSTAGYKFATSVAGLLCSLAWLFASKRQEHRLQIASDAVIASLAQAIPVNGAEYLVRWQLKQAAEQREAFQDQLDYAEQANLIADEQLGAIKRLETVFEASIGNLSARMVSAIEKLAASIVEINANALKDMFDQFIVMFKGIAEGEIARFRDELVSMTQGLEKISSNLNSSAENLDKAALSVKLAFNDLDVVLDRAKSIGNEGITRAESFMEGTQATLDLLNKAGDNLGHAAGLAQAVTTNLTQIGTDIETLSKEQRAVVDAVREAVPNATNAIAKLGDTMADAVRSSRDGMQSTAKTLNGIVTELNEGIAKYSDTVVRLHVDMDEQMAKAIGDLRVGIEQLETVLRSMSIHASRQVTEETLLKLSRSVDKLVNLRKGSA